MSKINMHKISECSMDDYVEHRLIEWAEWFGRCNQGGVGYPKTSSIHMFIQGSVVKRKKRNTAVPLPSHEAAEEIEAYLKEMHEQKPIVACAIRLHYLDHLSLRKNAEVLQVSHSHFKLCLSLGKQWLAGRIARDENVL